MFKNLISFKAVLWTTSIILAVCSAAFSVFGLSKLFAGAALSVIIMAATLEFAKLITVTFLHNYYTKIKTGMRYYLLGASVILMLITSLGVYGFLTNAYQLTLKTYSENTINSQFIEKNKEILNKEISYLEKQQQELTSRLQGYDKIRASQETAILNTNGKNNIQRNIKATSKLTDEISKKIDDISLKKNKLLDSLMTLEKQVLNIDLQNNQTELGPLIYISRISGYEMDYIVNIFVLIITLVFDPLAIALLLAANFLSKLTKNENDSELISNIEPTMDNEINDENFDEKINLENTEKIDILGETSTEIKHQSENEIKNNVDVYDDKSVADQNESTEDRPDQNAFYGETKLVNKHPWKVGT